MTATYLGHVPAGVLRKSINRGDVLSIGLGRTVKHLRLPDRTRPLVAHIGPRAPFAACQCGTFAEVSYFVGASPRCSAVCAGLK